MTQTGNSFAEAEGQAITEGLARVVRVDGGMAWLEPEQTTACGGCASAKVCGAEPGSRRLVVRRFALVNDHDLKVGDRVVVGVAESTVLRASLTTYGLPLLTMLAAGLTVQKTIGGDGIAALAAIAGLVLGFGLVRLWARRSAARGELTPHFIRRAFGPGPSGDCHVSDG